VSDEPLPDEVRRFVHDHIDSVERLEVLLLLHRHPRVWRAGEVSNERRSSDPAANFHLRGLSESGLLIAEADGFRIHGDPKLARTLDLVAQTFRERQVSVITFIYTKPDKHSAAQAPSDPLRAFVDAFRIKGDKKDG
jgi:hypothetical protein